MIYTKQFRILHNSFVAFASKVGDFVKFLERTKHKLIFTSKVDLTLHCKSPMAALTGVPKHFSAKSFFSRF